MKLKKILLLLFFVSTALPICARAEVLPWLIGVEDPWNSQKKIADYGKKLKPEHCPNIPQAKQKLGMNDVVIAVLCHNTDARNAYLSLLSEADNYVAGYSAYLPTIDALSAGRTYTTTYAGTSLNSTSSAVTKTSPTLEAGLTLYDFGQREDRIDAAEKALIAAGHSYDSTLQGTIGSALTSYYALLSAQKSVEVAQESNRVSKASLEAAELRYKLGLVAVADKLQASVASSNADLAIQRAENTLSQARSSLALLMGLAAEAEFEVMDTDDNSLTVDPFSGRVRELMETAKKKRADLEASRATLEGAKISESAAKRANRATISATVGVGFSDLDIGNTATSRSQNIGVNVSIPLFNGFEDVYSERVTRRGIEAQEATLAQAERDVEKDVLFAWQNYDTAKRNWEINQEQLKVAQQLQDVALGRYKEGVGTIIEVLTAQSSYQSALQTHLESRYNLLTTRLDLVRAVGVLNIDTIDPKETADGLPPPVAPLEIIDPKPVELSE